MSNGNGPLRAALISPGTPGAHRAGGAQPGQCRRGFEPLVPRRDVGKAGAAATRTPQKGDTL